MPRDISPGGPIPTLQGPVPIPYPNISEPGAALPAVPRPIPTELLPAEFRAILVRLREKFGAKLNVAPSDPEWVEISVENMPAMQLHGELQTARNTLFGEAASRVQVIQPLRATGPSIFLHIVTEPNWGDLARFSGK